MSGSVGESLHGFAAQLYPICRSITGGGVRDTLRLIGARIPLTIREVPSGSKVFDWQVPPEWNIEDAWVEDDQGERVIDFRSHNLHVVSYSEPVSGAFPLAQLEQHLHSLPEHPDWIPYRTSYYRRSWGFCLRDRDRTRLRPGRYRVEVRSSLAPGSLTYGETKIRGKSRDEVILFTHICHPSLANDNTSGMAIATRLAGWLAEEPRRYTYRLVFAPGTIGSLCWLKANEKGLGRVRHGLVLGLLGDSGALTYKRSRRGDSPIDAVAEYVLPAIDPAARVIDFSPYGYDERQLCSPGFNLPVGRLTRSVNDGYPEYHSSADDLSLIRPGHLEESYEACCRILTVLEQNARYVNLKPKGEPQLGKRGLYGSVGGRSPAERVQAMLWVLNQSDGTRSLLQVARRSGLSFEAVSEAAAALEKGKLLRAVPEQVDRKKRRGKGRGQPRLRSTPGVGRSRF